MDKQPAFLIGTEVADTRQLAAVVVALHDLGLPHVMFTAGDTDKLSMTHLLAQQVMLGIWGDGNDRKKKLEHFGYDYNAVQEYINEHLDDLLVELGM